MSAEQQSKAGGDAFKPPSNFNQMSDQEKQQTYTEWAKQKYNEQYEVWMPWIEDTFLKYFTKDNKASYATKGMTPSSPNSPTFESPPAPTSSSSSSTTTPPPPSTSPPPVTTATIPEEEEEEEEAPVQAIVESPLTPLPRLPDQLNKTKITGVEQVDTLQDGVHNTVAGQVGQGGLLQPVGDLLSKEGLNRAERRGKDENGGFLPSSLPKVPGLS